MTDALEIKWGSSSGTLAARGLEHRELSTTPLLMSRGKFRLDLSDGTALDDLVQLARCLDDDLAHVRWRPVAVDRRAQSYQLVTPTPTHSSCSTHVLLMV